MEKIIIIILLIVIIIQFHLHLRRSLKIAQLLSEIKYGLFGNGNGAMSKLVYLEYIMSKLDSVFKEPKIKYAGLENNQPKEK